MATWDHILVLPDSVAVDTSNHHGRELRGLNDICLAWTETVDVEQMQAGSRLQGAFLDVQDEFQAFLFNLTHGYYRQAAGCLRSALEFIAQGLCDDMEAEKGALRGIPIAWDTSFSEICDRLQKYCNVIEANLWSSNQDSLFAQKNHPPGYRGGWLRRHYDAVSLFTHARDGTSNAALWGSNGPVYSRDAFRTCCVLARETNALCLVLPMLADIEIKFPSNILATSDDEWWSIWSALLKGNRKRGNT